MTDLFDHNERFERGAQTRRAVVGDAYVDSSLAGADDFTAPFQQWVTETAWDMVWNRPDLDRRSRSMINLAMLTALNRPAELELHLRGALRNGVSVTEIREVLLQTAVYCGVPAALEAFKVAKKVLADPQN